MANKKNKKKAQQPAPANSAAANSKVCLLYTSDAADEL